MAFGDGANSAEGGERGFEVTPWSVEGKVDYERLMREFGTSAIDERLLRRLREILGEDHFLLRRGIFFSHRDLDLVLDDVESGRGVFLYTGRGPSGPMHVGHIIPFYFTRWLQEKLNANVYIQLTDDEKFLERRRGLGLEETRAWAYENSLDIIAVGFDPDRTFLVQDTEYMGNMYPLVLRIASKLTFNTVRATFGFTGETNIGLAFYPAVQIAPTMFERRRCLIPAAIDQDPYWRIQRDIAEDLGFYKAAAVHSKFIPPLTGPAGKMSASSPEGAIYLTDDPATVRRKIMKYAFSGGQPTVELHRRYGGNPDVDVAFQWLYMFFEPDDAKIRRIREDYISGALLSGELKEMLIERLLPFLEAHRERRELARETYHLYTRDGKLAREMLAKKHGIRGPNHIHFHN
ncbi:MAG: tryptophan--tRNA ligase [Nitrososphaeria archaeon]